MATTLTVDMIVQISGSYKSSASLANALQTLAINQKNSFTNGTGDNKSDRVFLASATASATPTVYDLDVGTDTVDEFGNSITFTKIRGLYIRNKSTTSGEILTIGGDWFTTAVLNGTAPELDIQPGSMLLLTAGIDGYVVSTNDTSDQLSIDPGANNVAFDLAIIGED